MTEPGDKIDQPRPSDTDDLPSVPPPPIDELAAILDQYMADVQAGKAPDRRQLLEAHPALNPQLEACLAGIDFINRATGPSAAADEPPLWANSASSARSAAAAWASSTRPSRPRSVAGVALKVLRFGVVADEEAMQRFRREAETVARLHHTNIVPIFAVGCERGVALLRHAVHRGPQPGRRPGREPADGQAPAGRRRRPLGPAGGRGPAHAHQRGVIHRDIKPSNLLIDAEGVIWLTDFGLAKRADEATLTVSGTLMGTPRYMSPEQAESMQRPVDHRTDLYSLGAIALRAGHRPARLRRRHAARRDRPDPDRGARPPATASPEPAPRPRNDHPHLPGQGPF